MPVNAIRLALAIALTLVVPGFLLVRALWPSRDAPGAPGAVTRAACVVAFSVALTTVVGVTLGFLPHAEGSSGWFRFASTGLPLVELTILVVSAGLFAVGYARGAYPRLGRGRDRSADATAGDG